MGTPRSARTTVTDRRSDFPSLKRKVNGFPLAYFDGPAGTQVPEPVIEAMSSYYHTSNSNTHGQFITTKETDRLIHESRTVLATFLGAANPSTISFGANMTTLAYALSHAMRRAFAKGDEIVITQLDHEANRGPWLGLQEFGITIREVLMKPDGTLDEEDFGKKVTPKTRLIAMGLASNALGTVNNIRVARDLARSVGAWLLLDAVHYAPHFPVDVQALDADFLLCSAYKFYGPHVGILYCRDGLLEQLEPDRLRTQDQISPFRIETGTLNHAAIIGAKAAVEYVASFGNGSRLRDRVVSGMNAIGEHEGRLARRIYQGLIGIDGIRVAGQPFDSSERAPTISFILRGKQPSLVCSKLAEKGVCAWDGHFYAIRPIEVLGLLEGGGVTRVGVSLYNTEKEAERLVSEVKAIAAS